MNWKNTFPISHVSHWLNFNFIIYIKTTMEKLRRSSFLGYHFSFYIFLFSISLSYRVICLLPACSCRRQRGSAGCGPPGVHSEHEQGGLHAHRLPDPHGWKQPVWHPQRGRRGAAHSRRRLACPPCIVVSFSSS